jgi:hypothetical protein
MSKPCSSKDWAEHDVTTARSNLYCIDQHRENLSNWIHCMCIVTFDLELGQVIEVYSLFEKYFHIYLNFK